MPERQQKSQAERRQLSEFWKESRRAFGELYRVSGKPSVLIAQNALENAVEQEQSSAAQARALLRNPDEFGRILMLAESDYQSRKEEKRHEMLVSLERKADWKVAAAISLGAGMITGVIFAVAGPFVGTWLQPTADELFKRPTPAQTVVQPRPQAAQSVTNNVYNFYGPEAKSQPKKNYGKLACKNLTTDTYNASLAELLQRGDIVTLEVNGKKVSMCYRPSVRHNVQHQALTKK